MGVVIPPDAAAHHLIPVKLSGQVDVVFHEHVEDGVEDFEGRLGAEPGDQVENLDGLSGHAGAAEAADDGDEDGVVRGAPD